MKTQMVLIGRATERAMKGFQAHFDVHLAATADEFERIANEMGAEIEAAATSGHYGMTAEQMDALPNLKVVSGFGVGYDTIDADYAARKGILVGHTPDVLNRDVANTAIMLLLATSRRLIRDNKWLSSGDWKRHGDAPHTHSIEGKPVGIVGLGRIGEVIAEKLGAFDCVVSYHTRNKKTDSPLTYYADLVALARDVDYLIVIVPGGAGTHKLINRPVIDALGRDGTLINIARGSVVDEAELVEALGEGRLGAAGLDVFENEPDVPEALLTMDNVVLTPHVGSATIETRTAMDNLFVDNLVRYFKDGRIPAPVPECAGLQDG
ncbi:MAG: 2-hydroxyacid dehydrogenase [Methyloligellaceae bacterium]